jgi:hypothetical protein
VAGHRSHEWTSLEGNGTRQKTCLENALFGTGDIHRKTWTLRANRHLSGVWR